MRSASVGFQCPECVRRGQASVRRPRPSNRVRQLAARFGVVTTTLVALNVGLFVLSAIGAVAVGASPNSNNASALFQQLSLVPLYVDNGDYWRLLTAAFMHYGLLHLAVNMLALVILGADIERYLGWARFLALYLVAVLAGGVAVTLFGDPLTQTVGASGGIFGLLGAAVVIQRRRRADLRPLISVIVLNVAISFLPGISLLDHLGGTIGGALAAFVLVYAPRGRTEIQLGGLVLLAAALIVPVLLRLQSSPF